MDEFEREMRAQLDTLLSSKTTHQHEKDAHENDDAASRFFATHAAKVDLSTADMDTAFEWRDKITSAVNTVLHGPCHQDVQMGMVVHAVETILNAMAHSTDPGATLKMAMSNLVRKAAKLFPDDLDIKIIEKERHE